MPKKYPDKHLEKGALTDYIKREYGEDGFTRDNKIKLDVLRSLKKGKKTPKGHTPNTKTRKRANFAINFRK